jgi:hypothetical protein
MPADEEPGTEVPIDPDETIEEEEGVTPGDIEKEEIPPSPS